jgi:hypothetical protein
VWNRLASWYGSRLAEQYGPHPPEDWCTIIDRIHDERLDAALSKVRHDSPMHPPTLGQLEAAIPVDAPKHPARHSPAELLCEFAVRKLQHSLCKHQIARTWNYFGSPRPEDRAVQPISGVQIPACSECDLPTHRVLLSELTHELATKLYA